ncbi:HLH transcription factor [Lentinula edodes]|uniref:HLH transcription factor n=1 Tax=Lentinula edodes TaxID=5353 RepID=A0A1Q3DVJ4_LENED|nr:HLH transcription factor [Lentinula edodes]
MSEQKRRNAIRDGYAQLITLLAPSGNAPALGMPTRGRPKGSGSRAKAGKKPELKQRLISLEHNRSCSTCNPSYSIDTHYTIDIETCVYATFLHVDSLMSPFYCVLSCTLILCFILK